jgi:hypothetical protein
MCRGDVVGIPGGKNGRNMKAVLPSHSVPAVVVHMGNETLYGVAYTSMIVGKQSEMVVAGGITLLPPGWHWIVLALSCIGVNTSVILETERAKERMERSNSSTESNCVFSEDDISSCRIVSDYLMELPNRRIGPDEFLIKAINYLFTDWISE